MGTKNIKSLAAKYRKDTNGNFAMIFAISSMVVIAGIGAAIDMGGAQSLRTNYQDMADAAVLAAVRNPDKKQAVMQRVAKSIVDDLDKTGTSPITTAVLSEDKKTLQVFVKGDHTSKIMHVFGKAKTNITVMAETLIEVNGYAEITLVLDTTRSMNYQGRLASLKVAANNFVDIIEDVDAGDRLRISVVPFGQYVNVGLDQRDEEWLDVPDDYTETFPDSCSMQPGPFLGQTCVPGFTSPTSGTPAQPAVPPQPATPPVYGTCFDDGVPHQCVVTPGNPGHPGYPAQDAIPPSPGGEPTTICTNNYGPSVEVCVPVPPIHHTWHGCVGSRNNSYNIDPGYSNGEPKVPGFLDLPCGAPILPMTSNMGAVRSKVNGLFVHGETYSAAGLIWGHRMVNAEQPFAYNNPAANGETPRRVVIFMTDGFNTRSRINQLHEGSDRSAADRTSIDICEDMNNDSEIEVYSVSFKVQDNVAKRLVKDCASDPSMYYEASNGNKLKMAFEQIAYSLLTPRLTQ